MTLISMNPDRPELGHYKYLCVRLSNVIRFALCGCILTLNAAHGSELNFDLAYTSEYWKVANGGIDSGEAVLSNFDISLETEFGGGTVFMYGLLSNSKSLSESLVGDLQTVSNIDNTKMWRLQEFWYSRNLFAGSTLVKAGIIDLNAEFDAIEVASEFINSSHGIDPTFSQTGENGPSIFPNTSAAVTMSRSWGENWNVKAGVFDSVPNDPENPERMDFGLNSGALLVGEVNYTEPGRARLGLGVWSYTDEFAALGLDDDAAQQNGNWGGYVFAEGVLFEEALSFVDIAGWIRIGHAHNDDVNYLESSFAGGLVLSGFLPSRANDTFGIAFARADAGSTALDMHRYAGDLVSHYESNLELFYKAELLEWLSVKPDIQYVINPGMSKDMDDALLFGLRIDVVM